MRQVVASSWLPYSSSAVARRTARTLLIASLAGLASRVADAAGPSPQVYGFIQAHCAECHDSATTEAGLDLTTLAFDPTDRANVALWVRVHDRVRASEMPPDYQPRPAAAEVESFATAIGEAITEFEQATATREGRSVQRRLNRYEYENALARSARRAVAGHPGQAAAGRRSVSLQQGRRGARCLARADGALHERGGLRDAAGDERATRAPGADDESLLRARRILDCETSGRGKGRRCRIVFRFRCSTRRRNPTCAPAARRFRAPRRAIARRSAKSPASSATRAVTVGVSFARRSAGGIACASAATRSGSAAAESAGGFTKAGRREGAGLSSAALASARTWTKSGRAAAMSRSASMRRAPARSVRWANSISRPSRRCTKSK